MLELDCGLDFDPACEEDFYAALPPRPGVARIELRGDGAEPYLLRSSDLRRRMERLLRAPDGPTKRLNLREQAARVRFRMTGSAFEQSLVVYEQAREFFPRRYRALLRLRPPALLKVNLANAYPRCYVTRRILSDGGYYYGPFASRRAAEAFARGFLDFFKARRCQIKIRRDPDFPGCLYSEMKMCLAPCFAGCTKEEYEGEVGRVVNFLGTGGGSLVAAWGQEREAASETLDFERAAALHRKLEKLHEVLRGLPELARRIEELDAVILQRAAEDQTIAIFAVRGGLLVEPFFLRFGELASQPRSVEEILREQLRAAPAKAARGGIASEARALSEDSLEGAQPRGEISRTDSAAARNDQSDSAARIFHEQLAEHLALVARWYYAKPREGEIFFPQRAKSAASDTASTETPPLEWPYRRMIRACSRLLAPREDLQP